jgi:hypothetical protein
MFTLIRKETLGLVSKKWFRCKHLTNRLVDMAHTDEDTETVLNLIGCLDHGMFV